MTRIKRPTEKQAFAIAARTLNAYRLWVEKVRTEVQPVIEFLQLLADERQRGAP